MIGLIRLTFVLFSTTLAASAPVVDLGYAQFAGFYNESNGINTFRGIRYAAPPTGSLRWKAPVPIDTVEGIYPQAVPVNATSFGPQCVQAGPAWQPSGSEGSPNVDPNIASEDCLLLDVIAPKRETSELLPVFVQIHGGAYIMGRSNSADGTRLVSYSNGGIVYVQIQYRLGAYGFLGGSEVRDDGVLNAGLHDQRQALLWVQKYIAAFGGDPKKVTIWGGSAGGGSVIYQLLRGGGEADPPFRAAISEYPGLAPHRSITTQDALYNLILKASGCDSLGCLRSLSYLELANATQQSYVDGYAARLYGYGDFGYTPVVDGSFLKDLPSKEIASGHFTRVPLLIDHNEFEGIGFTNTSVTTQAQIKDTLQVLLPDTTPQFFQKLMDLYPARNYQGLYFLRNDLFRSPLFPILAITYKLNVFNTAYWQMQTIFGDAVFKCPTQNLAQAGAKARIPTWKMAFNAPYYGHGATGSYLLGSNGGITDLFSNETISAHMKDYWLSFVSTLDPNKAVGPGVARPFWPSYGSEQVILRINQTRIRSQVDGDASEQCRFLLGQGELTRL